MPCPTTEQIISTIMRLMTISAAQSSGRRKGRLIRYHPLGRKCVTLYAGQACVTAKGEALVSAMNDYLGGALPKRRGRGAPACIWSMPASPRGSLSNYLHFMTGVIQQMLSVIEKHHDSDARPAQRQRRALHHHICAVSIHPSITRHQAAAQATGRSQSSIPSLASRHGIRRRPPVRGQLAITVVGMRLNATFDGRRKSPIWRFAFPRVTADAHLGWNRHPRGDDFRHAYA